MSHKKIFYSQIGEDILIYNNFINKYKEDGTYVEIGGGNGIELSNTKFFNDNLGFKGILIEADPMFYNELVKNRPNDICVNIAVDYTYGEKKFLGHSHCGGLIEYLSPILKDKHLKNAEEYIVNTSPISKIIKDANLKYIDYFSIDVEGAELAVLETMDWSIPIYIINIELNEKKTENDFKGIIKNEKCRQLLKDKGFIFLKQIDINEFWINENYFRKELLYDTSIEKFKTLKDAGLFMGLAEHLEKEVQDNLNLY